MADGGIEFLVDITAKTDAATAAASALDGVTEAAGRSGKALSGVDAEFDRLQKQLSGLRKPARIDEMKREIAALQNPAKFMPDVAHYGPHEATPADQVEMLQKRLRELRTPGQLKALRQEIHSLENPEPPKNVGFLAKMFGEAEAAAGGLVSGLGPLVVGGVAIAGVGMLAHKIGELGMELLKTAGEAQRTERAIALLMGEDVAPDILEWIDQMARSTEFTDGTLKSLAISLSRAGFKGEDLSRAMSAVSDMAAMSEDKLEGAGAAAEMLSRIRLKGGLGDRDLLRLGIAPDAFYKKLGKDLGMGAKEVEKQLLEGKIKAEDVIESVYAAIAAKTGKPLGGAGLTMTATFLSQLEKANDIVPNLFEGLSQSGGLDKITAALGRLTTALAPDSPAGRKIIEGLERMLNTFADMTTKIDMDKFADTTVRLFQALPPLITASVKALELFANVLERIVNRGWDISGGTTEAVTKALGASDKTGTILGNAAELAAGGDLASGGVMSGMYLLGSALMGGFANGITDSADFVYDAMGNVVGMADAAVRDKAEIHSPSRRFARLGAMTGAGFREGIADSAPDIRDAMQMAFVAEPAAVAPDGYASPGGRSVSLDVTINIGSVTGDEEGARMVAEEAGFGVRQAFQSVLEQLAAEGA